MSASEVIRIALNEVGYLEKASNSNLNDKTANAGYNNWTKYGAWYGSGLNGQPWCDMFVSYCADQAGEATAVGKFAYVPSHIQFFKNKGQYFSRGAKTPQAGDIIFFGDEAHVGFVEYVQNGYVHTIEGNTSSGTTLVANGGGVHQKYYPLTSSYILGYGRPSYQSSSATSTVSTTAATSNSKILGIDVSEHNGTLDWAKIKAAGIQFAIIRAGYGRYKVDGQFVANIKGAIAQGIPVGVYWFTYALNTTTVKEEAQKCIDTIKGYEIKLPVFFDFEYDTVRYAKENGVALGKDAFNNHTVAFLEVIKSAGYKAGTYFNLDYYKNYYDSTKLGRYVKWYAQYNNTASWTGYDIWQYSSNYRISGINCDFDINVMTSDAWNTIIGGATKYKVGWNQDSKGWWWSPDGNSYYQNQWLQYKDNYYFFDSEGYMVHDKSVEYDGKLYVFDSDGHCTSTDIQPPTEDGDDEMLTYEQFKEYMNQYRKELQDNDAGKWSQADREWAIGKGLIQGGDPLPDGTPNYMWADFLTREQASAVFHRFARLIGQE